MVALSLCCCNTQESIASSFSHFCPISLVPLPALLPSFQGTRRMKTRSSGGHSQGVHTEHPCSGLLPGLEIAGGMEAWDKGCWHIKLTFITWNTCYITWDTATENQRGPAAMEGAPPFLFPLNPHMHQSHTASKLCFPMDNLTV